MDVVARGRFRGRQSCFLVHVENQAQKQKNFNVRMFTYFARLHEKYRLPIYPVAIFSHDWRGMEPDSYQMAFPDCEVLKFRFRVIQLKRLHWRDFLRQRNPVASALMAKMGFKPAEKVQVKVECLRLLARFKLSRARAHLINGFIDTYLHLTAKETLKFQENIATLPDRNERIRVMKLTNSWKEEGRREGREQGLQQGGQRIILRQLRRRLGTVPRNLQKKVRCLTIHQTEALAEELLNFSSPHDLESWLSRS